MFKLSLPLAIFLINVFFNSSSFADGNTNTSTLNLISDTLPKYCSSVYSSETPGAVETCLEGGLSALKILGTNTDNEETLFKTCGDRSLFFGDYYKNYFSGSSESCYDGFLYVLALSRVESKITLLNETINKCSDLYRYDPNINRTCIQGVNAAFSSDQDEISLERANTLACGSKSFWNKLSRNYFTGSRESCIEGFNQAVIKLKGL